MCSILGYYNTSLTRGEIESLNTLMSHRGPNNSKVCEYLFNTKKLYLGHNRLSIQDLESHANQPMENKRFSIVFNGEIYNHIEIRKDLNFTGFKTHSDTETLIYAFEEWGIEKTLSKLIGMFAIGLFDKLENKLYLIRDRVGIKPLYWLLENEKFIFSSELKGFDKVYLEQVNNKSLVQFMTLGYTPYNNTYFKNIHKLPPAHYLIFDGRKVDIKKYWALPSNTIDISYAEAVEESERLIRSSIKYRLVSDLEVGSFLSGGIDSSLTSSIMQQESNKSIKTFSIGFEDKKYDESLYAKQIANYIGSEHYEYTCTPQDVIGLFDNFDKYFDEPFGDASSLPMMLLSKMTKNKVTVALSGDGGDELFLGYNRYFLTQKYFNRLNTLSPKIRNVLSVIAKYSGQDKLQKISYPLKNLSQQNIYALVYCSIKPWELSKVFDRSFLMESFGKSNLNLLDLLEYECDGNNLIDSLSRLDFYRYLPDDILTKVDRASMAYGLEARVPLLDHRIVEFSYSLPVELKLREGPKSILKEILYRQIPKTMIDRPKKGFSVPLRYWFRNELKNIVYEKINTLDDRFNKQYLLKIFNEHQKGRNFEYVLWNILRLK